MREQLGLGDAPAECSQCGACDGDSGRAAAPDGSDAGQVNEEEVVRAVLARLGDVLDEKGERR